MKRMHLFFLSALALCVFYCGSALADPVIDKVQETYKQIQSLRADFTQVLVHKESGSRKKLTGVLYFKKPLLMRWDVRAPSPELLIVNPKVIWNVFPDEEVAYKYAPDLAQDSRSVAHVVTGQASLSQDFFVENTGEEKGLVSLRLYPKEPTESLVEARLWVDAKSGFIRRVCLYDFFGNENDISFSKMDSKSPVANTLFDYTPQKGIDVEDRTKEKGHGSLPMM
ncbi:outer membrane lipoprotein carrier protein LolA [Desulfovibrio sp. OttesenSCG-928-A18]|nr:outer membrane lipoprotein carrier protein LolA [Desulfovibrio sp. OttesenSCG-928-A18]